MLTISAEKQTSTATNTPKIQTAMTYRALTDDQMFELEQVFTMFDANRDGIVELDDFRHALECLGETPTEDKLIEMFRSVDLDCDNQIDFDEFVVYMKPKIFKPLSDKELRRVFQLFDVENKGYLRPANIMHAVEKLIGKRPNKRELKAMMKQADITGSGKISFAEFRLLMLF